eukprot:10865866-Alexandrium_andersonii.AAC.1
MTSGRLVMIASRGITRSRFQRPRASRPLPRSRRSLLRDWSGSLRRDSLATASSVCGIRDP